MREFWRSKGKKKRWKLVVGECLLHNVILFCDTCNYDCEDSHVSPLCQSNTNLNRAVEKKRQEKEEKEEKAAEE